jgi:hypothetical protein
VESPRTLIDTPAERVAPPPHGPRRRIVARRRDTPPARGDELVLGRYRLLQRLGAGGFGEVWRARDERLDREVAVKRIPIGFGGDSERAGREALATARLAHPAIVALYEAGERDGCFYLISELVDGDTLAALIAARELSDDDVLEIGIALAGALVHAHSRGVIHRDIKPQNVLVPHRSEDAAGVAKLADFGGASLIGEEALTRTGDVLGTLAYMAPEQSDGREACAETDLYALALLLYEALSGVNPVRGSTPAATAKKIGRRIAPLERRRRDLPRELTRAIDAALDPLPQRRGSVEELRAALAAALERAARPSRRRRRLTAARGLPPAATPAAAALDERPAATRAPAAVAAEPPAEEDPERRTTRLALPRSVWIAPALALVVWQVWAGRPGVALLIAVALLPLAALPRRAEPLWLACLLAPALGVAGLAGVFPAVAGQARRWTQRALLGALGYWWLLLAEPLLERRLWLGVHAGTPSSAVWHASLNASAVHVVWPLLGAGALLGALLWACAAAVLPWIVRGRNASVDIVAATMWSAAVVAAEPALDRGLAAGAAALPRGAVVGGVLAGVVAVAARALRGPV